MKSEFQVQGMHCQACAERISKALRQVPGVAAARVTLAPPRAEIETTSPVATAALDQAARSAGDYSLHQMTTAATTPTPSLEEGALSPKPSLYPLFLIVSFILGTTALTTFIRGDRSPWTFMNDFMAGFFLVFSFFKLLDLKGFASTYRSYDLVARRWSLWGYAYPFIELALGVAYLIRWQPTLTNLVTLAIMLVGSAGVLRALVRKDAIRCACLGTALNLPMTTITLTEDLVMAGMAAAMLIGPH